MRAVVHAGPGLLRLEERVRPSAGPGELGLRVRGCGLCGSDLSKLRGPAPVPVVLGHEVVGEITELGDGVEGFRVGDRVVVAHHVPCFSCHYCRRGSVSMCRAFKRSNLDPGGFAEYVRVPAENAQHATFRVPDHVSDVVASFTEPLACCLRAVRRSAVGPGDAVVVLGLGAMGSLLLQLFLRTGALVVGVDVVAERRRLGQKLGLTVAVAPADLPETLAGLSGGRGVDCAVLTAGAPALVREAFGWVRDGGQVHLFVGDGEGVLPVGDLYRRELTLTATYSSSPADLAEAFELLCAGRVRVAELASHRLPLARLPDAPGMIERQEALKVFVEMDA